MRACARRLAAGRETEWVWPHRVPLTPGRAFPDVARLVLRSGSPALVGVTVAALAGGMPWETAATAPVCALLIAVEETAHLATAARAAPGVRLALVTRFPWRVVARIRPPLPPRTAAAVALAGPLAAGGVGLLCVTLPLAVRNLLPETAGAGYAAWAPALLPPLWLLAAALPLPGSDAAVVRAAQRVSSFSLRALWLDSVRLLVAAARPGPPPIRSGDRR